MYKAELAILVSGSAKLDIYRQGGDSLMGRYFLYRIHPLSLGELVRSQPTATLLATPAYILEEQLKFIYARRIPRTLSITRDTLLQSLASTPRATDDF